MSEPAFRIFPTEKNVTELAQRAKKALSATSAEKAEVACGLQGEDIITCEMIQDGAVKIPKIDIGVIAAAWVDSEPQADTPDTNNIDVKKSKYLKIEARPDATDPNKIQGRYTATFVDENCDPAPRSDCYYQVAINVIHDVGSTSRDDYGAWVRQGVCEPGYFEYDILLSDDGTDPADYRNAFHSIIVTDFDV